MTEKYFALQIMLIAALVMLAGCSHDTIIVPFDAPLQLSQNETIHKPYAWLNGKWTQTGDVQRGPGATILLIPSTRP